MVSKPNNYTLQRPDGSAVTAQEFYDAIMSGVVYFETGDGIYYALSDFSWIDASGTREDSANVAAISVATSGDHSIMVGSLPK